MPQAILDRLYIYTPYARLDIASIGPASCNLLRPWRQVHREAFIDIFSRQSNHRRANVPLFQSLPYEPLQPHELFANAVANC